MASIDVTELFVDPDFVSNFIILRAVQAVDDHGRMVEQITQLGGVGSVQPATDRTYEMFPEAARVNGSVEIYTLAALTPPTDDLSADEIVWKGKLFTVVGVQDWNNFGGGFTMALCNLKSLTAPDHLYNRNSPGMTGSRP